MFSLQGNAKNIRPRVTLRKKTTKNTYIRIKDKNTIYITTNIRTSDREIFKLIEENKSSIKRMLNKNNKKINNNKDFWFLGKKYDKSF